MDLLSYSHEWPPPHFMPVDRNGEVNLVVGPTPNILETIDIGPAPYTGWIREMGIACSNWANATYTILQGGAPLRDYTLKNSPAGSVETPRRTYIKLLPNLPLQLTAVATGPARLRWVLLGWYFNPTAQGPLGGPLGG